MIHRTKSTAVVLLCFTGLIVAACGSGSTPTETSTASGSDTVTSETPETSDSEATSAPSNGDNDSSGPSESPIGDLLGIPITDDDAMEEFIGQLQRDAERKTSECMLAQGFEYTVVDYSSLDAFDTSVDFDSREFAEAYGFGISSNPQGEAFEAFQSFEDPNRDYVEALSPGEAEAYQTALNGELPDFDSSDDIQSFVPGGCQGEAYEEVFAFGLVFEEFGDELTEIEEAFEADPRIVTASAGWADCMADAGYRFADAEDAESDFQRRYDAIVSEPGAFAEAGESLTTSEGDGLNEETFVFGPSSLAPEFQERVDALAVEERAVAVASWDCNAPLREIQDDIQIEYEQRFVDQHGDAIRAALAD